MENLKRLFSILFILAFALSCVSAAETIKTFTGDEGKVISQLAITANQEVKLTYFPKDAKRDSVILSTERDINAFIDIRKTDVYGSMDFERLICANYTDKIIKMILIGLKDNENKTAQEPVYESKESTETKYDCRPITTDRPIQKGDVIKIIPKPGSERIVEMPNGQWGYSVYEDLYLDGVQIKDATWWNVSFGERHQVNVTNQDSAFRPLILASVNLTFPTTANNCLDVVIANKTEAQTMPMWVDFENSINGSYCYVYFLADSLASSGTNSYYAYSNSTAGTYSNYCNVFICTSSDEFNQPNPNIDFTKWVTWSDGGLSTCALKTSPNIQGKAALLQEVELNNTRCNGIRNKDNYTIGNAVTTIFRYNFTDSLVTNGIKMCINAFSSGANGTLPGAINTGACLGEKMLDGEALGDTIEVSGYNSNSPTANVWYIGRLGYTGTSTADFWRDTTLTKEKTTLNTRSNKAILFQAAAFGTGNVLIDYVRTVLAYWNNTPTTSVGSSESLLTATVVTENYTNPDFETSNNTFLLNITAGNDVSEIINASLFWNNTFAGLGTRVNTSNFWNFSRTYAIPLIVSNDSNIDHYWSFYTKHINGSIYEYTTTTVNQTLFYAYYVENIAADKTNLIEGDTATFTTSVKKVLNLALTSVTNWIGTNHVTATLTSSNSTADVYSGSLASGTIATINSSSAALAQLDLTFGAQTASRNFTTSNVTVHQIYLGNCSDGNATTTAVNATFVDELIPTYFPIGQLDSSWTLTKGTISRSYSFSQNGSSFYPFCISPAWATYTTSSTFTYGFNSSTLYRSYYLSGASISNDTTNITLIFPDVDAAWVTINILTTSNIAVQNATVYVQRYFPATGTYSTVASAQTDVDGRTFAYISRGNINYRFVVYVGGTVAGNFGPFLWPPTIDSTTLRISDISIASYWLAVGPISSSCSYVNTTSVFRCTIVDSSGVMSSTALVITQISPGTNSTACSTSGSGPSATIQCVINGTYPNIFHYYLSATSGGIGYALRSDLISFAAPVLSDLSIEFKNVGLFACAFLILLLGLAGIWNPTAAIVLSLLGVLFGYFSGFILITSPLTISWLIIVAIIIIIRMRT